MTPEEQIQHKYTYHAPVGDQVQQYERIRIKAKELELLIATECPNSPEKEYARHYVGLASMCANQAIAQWGITPYQPPTSKQQEEIQALYNKIEQELAHQMHQEPRID